MTSRLGVVDDADVVWVLIWLVEYSRGVVYVTELISVTGGKTSIKKSVRQGVASPRSVRAEGMIRAVGGHGAGGGEGGREKGMEAKGTGCETFGGGNIYACVGRQIFTRA